MSFLDPRRKSKEENSQVSRRAFLRGAGGVSLALPWLEIDLLASDKNAAKAPPLRFACVYFSNGVEPAHWWAKGSGSTMDLGPGLKPLQKYTDDILFLQGLYNEQSVKNPSAHLGRMPNLLSGSWVSLDQNDIRVGTTMDQILASRIGQRTEIPSLVVGIEPNELRLEDGLSMIYGSCISWRSPTKPATKEIYPSRIFDQLVGNGESRELDASVLDEVLVDAKRLLKKATQSDRQKLDEYLDSIRDIEKRIAKAKKNQQLEGFKPPRNRPGFARPADELPQNIPEHMKLVLDLIVLAFQMDKTRIATCMLNNDLSQMNFGFLEGVEGSLHLDLTHNGRNPKLEAMYLKTNQFHVQQCVYLLERLKGIREGEGTLLDNSLLMFCSNLFDGDKHEADKMPIVLAGGAGGSLKTGRVLDYLNKGDDSRRACSLYLSIMDRFGVQLPSFGDTDKRLSSI